MEIKSKIVDYFKSFNENHNGYHATVTAIEYLDDVFPQWRNEINNKEEWESVFTFDIHIYKNSYLQEFANVIFDIVGGTDILETIWRNKKLNDFYRYAAIQRLIKFDESKYLPEYVNSIKSGELTFGGWWLPMINDIFNFSNAVDVALEMYNNSSDELNVVVRNISEEYLASNACRYWEIYPENVKNDIINTRNYFILKGCTPQMWSILSLPHKFILSHAVVLNEYKNMHDILSFCKYLEDKNVSQLYFFKQSFRWEIQDIERNDHIRTNQFEEHHINMILNRQTFDMPTFDRNTHEYIPSLLMQNFLQLSKEDDSIHSLLFHARNELLQLCSHM